MKVVPYTLVLLTLGVWRDGLYLKLLNNGANPKFVRLLRNIYSSSSLAIKVAGGRSTIFPSKVGLKQGCNLSPLLFNIFINDFLTEISMSFTHSPLLNGIPINGLMYADDLVLISKSEEGLQNLLDMLHRFTESWFLQVNKSKTKCVTFSRTKLVAQPQMKFGSDPIESVDSYCYLGTTFTKNGSLNEASRVLHSKAVKAMYGLLRKVNKHKSCNPKILLDLFDKMILPIARYNFEIWGTMCLPYNPRNNDLLNVKSSKNLVEDLQFKFCKRILNVADRSTNWAVTAECGRLPTMIHIINRMITTWFHIASSRSPILRAALHINAQLAAGGRRCWFFYIRRCLKFMNLEHILYTSDVREVRLQIKKVKKLLTATAISEWNTARSSNCNQDRGRLHLFYNIKSDFGLSPYLGLPIDSKWKTAITKFRFSAHNLPIETGRYLNIPRYQRFCPLCSSGTGSEVHYLTECDYPAFSEMRASLYSSLKASNPTFVSLSEAEKAVFLLDNPDPKIATNVGKICDLVLDHFKDLNSSRN